MPSINIEPPCPCNDYEDDVLPAILEILKITQNDVEITTRRETSIAQIQIKPEIAFLRQSLIALNSKLSETKYSLKEN